MTSFPSHSLCTDCDLHLIAKSVGIASEWDEVSLPPSLVTPCVFVVAQNPGREEDLNGRPMIGPLGRVFRRVWIPPMEPLASVYLGNGARCGPDSVTRIGPYNARFPHLEEDLRLIADTHSNARRAILFTSAPSVRAFYRATLGENVGQKVSFKRQGERVEVAGIPWRIFSTYHPGYIQRGHDEEIATVEAHIALLCAYLRGEPTPKNLPDIVPPAPPPFIMTEDAPFERIHPPLDDAFSPTTDQIGRRKPQC